MSITTKIFLASSAELKADRAEFEILINRRNNDWNDRGVFLKLVVWEDFLDAVSRTGLQDDYNKAIEECDIFVMLYWTKVGRYTDQEFETAFSRFKATDKPPLFIYFRTTKTGVDGESQPDPSLSAFQEKLKVHRHYPTQYENVGELKYHFYDQLQKLAKSGFFKFDRDEAPPPASAPPAWSNTEFQSAAQQHSPYFRDPAEMVSKVGGALEWNTLQALPARVALLGPPGIGKTELALAYAQQRLRGYAGVCWIRARDQNTLASSLERCCRELQVPASESDVAASALKRWLDLQSRPWLLIVDGADGSVAADLEAALPATLGHHVLITSTNPRWPGALKIEIRAWNAEQGAAYLRRRIPTATEEDARQLSEDLSGSPRALDLAACYIEECGCSIEEYRNLFAELEWSLEQLSLGEKSIHGTVKIAFDALPEQAQQCIRLCAAAASEWLPERYLRDGGELLPVPLRGIARNDRSWIELRAKLVRTGLIDAVRDDLVDFEGQVPGAEPESVIRIGHLTQSVIRTITLDDGETDRQVMIGLLQHAMEGEAAQPPHWPRRRLLALHAREAGLEAGDPAGARLAKIAGDWLSAMGDPWAAYACRLHWKDVCERHASDPADPVLIEAQLDFAEAVLKIRNYAAAEEWARHVLDRARLGGVARPRLEAAAGSVLIKSLLQQQRFPAALDLAVSLQRGNPFVASDADCALDILFDMAQALRGLGRLELARTVQERIVAAVHGRWPGSTIEIDACHQLAATQFELGQFESARTLQLRVLAARRAQLPFDALQVGQAELQLARTLVELGDRAAASVHFDLALSQLEISLPVNDPLRLKASEERASVKGRVEGVLR